MSSIPEYERGFRDGLKAAITALHHEASDMNDPSARRVLNSAAFSLSAIMRDIHAAARQRRRWVLGIRTPATLPGAPRDEGDDT